MFELSELFELFELSESGLSTSDGSEVLSALELVENGLKRRTEIQKGLDLDETWY